MVDNILKICCCCCCINFYCIHCSFIQATPHLSNKRKSLHGRKLRPKSVVDSVEGLSADDIPDLLPSLPKSQAEGSFYIRFNSIGNNKFFTNK